MRESKDNPIMLDDIPDAWRDRCSFDERERYIIRGYFKVGKSRKIKMKPIREITADINIDRLAEICEAEREGRLRILVRHSVPHNTKAYIYDHYDELQQGKIIHGKNAYAMRFICETTAFDISNYDIGRNVFLTREEAEKALEERSVNRDANA